MKKVRLDQLLVDKGLAQSRERAKITIMEGSVFVDGQRVDKPGTAVDPEKQIEVRGASLPYVSRGGLKLEKALKVDPSYDDAKYDLEFAQTFLKDRIETVPEFFVKGWIRSLRCSLSSNVWAVMFLVLLAVALGLTLLFLLGRSSAARKTGFFTGLVALLLSLMCLGFSLRLRAEYSANSSAIVVSPVTVARSAPDNSSGTDLFLLHEGTKVKVLDSVGSWDNIELSDGRQGWILTNELEII